MSDRRLEAAARALCVLGGGHTTAGTYPNCDHVAQHEDGARVALAASDAVDPVREAARDALHCCCAVHGSALREALATQEASDD